MYSEISITYLDLLLYKGSILPRSFVSSSLLFTFRQKQRYLLFITRPKEPFKRQQKLKGQTTNESFHNIKLIKLLFCRLVFIFPHHLRFGGSFFHFNANAEVNLPG